MTTPKHLINPNAKVFEKDSFVDRLMGNEDLARRILRGFVEDMPLQLARCERALASLDAKALRLAAHSIKGSAASVGGEELQSIAGKLEQTAILGDMSAAAVTLPELSAGFDRAKVIMKTFCSEGAQS